MAESTPDDVKSTIRRFYDAFAPGKEAGLLDVVAEDWQDHTLPPGRNPGRAGLQEALHRLLTILPDLRTEVVQVIAEGELAAIHIVFSGTYPGGLPGAAAGPLPIRFLAFDMHRVQGGLIRESWHLEDNASLFQQLGLVPHAG